MSPITSTMTKTNLRLGNTDRQIAWTVKDALMESRNPREASVDGESLQIYLAKTGLVEELTDELDTPMYQGGVREQFLDYTFAKKPKAQNLIFGTLSKAINIAENTGQITENPRLTESLDEMLRYEGFKGLESREEIERVREIVADQEKTYKTIEDESPRFAILPSHRQRRKEKYSSLTGRIRQAATGVVPTVDKLGHEYRSVYIASHGFNNY